MDEQSERRGRTAEGVVLELLPSQLVRVELEGRHIVTARRQPRRQFERCIQTETHRRRYRHTRGGWQRHCVITSVGERNELVNGTGNQPSKRATLFQLQNTLLNSKSALHGADVSAFRAFLSSSTTRTCACEDGHCIGGGMFVRIGNQDFEQMSRLAKLARHPSQRLELPVTKTTLLTPQ